MALAAPQETAESGPNANAEADPWYGYYGYGGYYGGYRGYYRPYGYGSLFFLLSTMSDFHDSLPPSFLPKPPRARITA